MSLYGMMRTGVSGMNGQANRLSAVSDNIANSNTTGYKRAKAEFSTLIIPGSRSSYNSGGVTTDVRYEISQQGVLNYTTSVTDLALGRQGEVGDRGVPVVPAPLGLTVADEPQLGRGVAHS